MLRAIAIITLLIAAEAEAKDLYVNNSGSPACSDSTTYADNSASRPWCTIGRAAWGNAVRPSTWPGAYRAEAARSGDVVHITGGTYHYPGTYNAESRWQALYQLVNSSTATDYITFTTLGGNVTLTSSTAGSHVLVGADHGERFVKWHGGNHWFVVNQANMAFRPGSGVLATQGDHTWIERWDIEGIFYEQYPGDQHVGILAQGPGGATCTGGLNNLTIRNNRVHGFVGTSSRNDSAITMYCLGDNILIEQNEIFGNRTGIYGKSSNRDSVNIHIRNNLFHSNEGDAIAMQAFDDWRVYRNVMRGNSGAGFHFMVFQYFQGNPKPTDTYVVNNTFDGNQVAFQIEGLCANMDRNFVWNNLVTNNVRPLFTEDTACTAVSSMGPDDISFNHNLYRYGGSFWSTDYSFSSTLANFRASYGQDPDSIENRDPRYLNAGAGDYRLQAGSPAVNAGIDILDLNGNGSTADPITLGAYITGDEVIGVAPTSGLRIPTGISVTPAPPR